MTLDELLLEWSYRSERGYPSVDSPSDVLLLETILEQLDLPVDEIINNLDEITGLSPGKFRQDANFGPFKGESRIEILVRKLQKDEPLTLIDGSTITVANKEDVIVALRGDAVKSENYFKPTIDGHSYANELVSQITNLNKGIYLDEEMLNPNPTNFCTGVSGYPEKHMEAPSIESDIHFLKKKIKLGADYIVTQMFFDNKKFFDFVEICRKEGINVPIIPGLKPISTLKQLNILPQRFHCDLPEELIKEVIKCKDNKEVKEVGIEWCMKQSKELKKAGVPFLHYYSMGKSMNIKRIASEVF